MHLFTGGGLLASVPADTAAACIAALHTAGYPSSAVIGHVGPPIVDKAAPTVTVVNSQAPTL